MNHDSLVAKDRPAAGAWSSGLPPLDVDEERLEQIEAHSDALERALELLWQPARSGGPLTRVVAAAMIALVELHRAKTELSQEGQSS